MMNKKKFYGAVLCAAMAIPLFMGCSKNDGEEIENPSVPAEYLYVLNSGLWNSNNASLSLYNLQDGTVIGDIFEQQNGRRLGDTGNDMIVYGSKIYIAMAGESTIEITDLDAKSLQQIKTDGQPRAFTSFGGKVYVTLFNGYVARIDTTSMNIEAKVQVGRNPEQLAAVNGKLYVANSGGLDFPNYDKTVSVVDIASFTEVKKLDVALNPCNMTSDNQGNIYVVSLEDYSSPGVVQKISAQDDAVSVLDVNGSYLTLLGNTLYLISSEYDENSIPTIYYYSYDIVNNRIISDNFAGNTKFSADPYQICSDENSGEIFIPTSDYVNTGDVYVFDKNGNFSYSFEAGLSPIKVVKINR